MGECFTLFCGNEGIKCGKCWKSVGCWTKGNVGDGREWSCNGAVEL